MAINTNNYKPYAWDKLKVKAEELKNKKVNIFNTHNHYGYKLNINHPIIKEYWQAFCIEWEQECNVEQIDTELWRITTSIGTYDTSKPSDYTDRRLQFENLMLTHSQIKPILQQEVAIYGASFRAKFGFDLTA